MKVLSIDIGIVNFAFTFWNNEELKDFDKIDITTFIKDNEQKCIAVYMKNLFNKIAYFEKADFILKDGGLIFEISANRFLRNMVRSVVGTLIEVGLKK